MFITKQEYDISDFLNAVAFIPPQGYSVESFITPENIQLPEYSGFTPQYENTTNPEDESVIYMRTQPVQKIDQAQSPAEFSQWQPGELKRKTPTPNILPKITEPENLDCPFIKIINESIIYGTDIKLLEDYYMFPKNTLFHCVKDKLQEGIPKDYEKYDAKRYGKEFRAPDYISHNGTTRWERVKVYKWIDHLLDDLGRSQWQNAIDIMAKDKSFMSNFENERYMRKAVANHLYYTKRISYRQFENYCDSLYPKPVETLEDVLKRPHTKGDLDKFKEAAELKKPDFMTRMFVNQHIQNEKGFYTVATTPNLDNYIDEALADGSTIDEVTDTIWNDRYYRKSFGKTDTDKKEIRTYVKRRKAGVWNVEGDGNQGIFDFGDDE